MNSRASALCWILNAPYDIVGGAGNRFRAEVSYFSRSKIPVNVICRRPHQRGPAPSTSLAFPTRLLPLYLLELFLKTIQAICHNERLTLIVHDPLSAVPASFAALLFKKKTRAFLVVHGPMYLEQKWLARRGLVKTLVPPLLFIIEKLAYALAYRLVAVSEYETNYLSKQFGMKNKVSLIRNGISIERFVNAPVSEFRKEIGVPFGETLIINVGHLYTYRGLSNLLEAVALARTEIGGEIAPKLAVVGKDKGTQANFDKYSLEVEQFRIKDLVTFVDDRPDIPQILKAGDIYAERFSKQVNGIGIAIMEAMAAGLPVITGFDWITSRLLHDGYDCLLVEKENSDAIAQAICALTRNPELRKRLGQNAQETAKALFSLETMLHKCESEYVDLAFQDNSTRF